MRIAMSAKSRLLDLQEFREEVLVSALSFDNLEGGGCRICCGEGGGNGVHHPVVHELEDPLSFEIHAQVVGVEEIGAEQWSSNIGQDELVGEGDVGKIEMPG